MGLFSLLKYSKRKNAFKDMAERDAPAAFVLSQLMGMLGAKDLGSLNVSMISMLGISAVFAAVRIRGETLANLPFRVIEGHGKDRVVGRDTWLTDILQSSPDGQISSVEFFHTMESHSCLTGCAYAYIERNIYGEPVRLIQVPSYEVSYILDDYNQPNQHLEYNVRGIRTSSRDLIVIPFAQVYPYWSILRPQSLLNTPVALAQALDKEAYDLFKNGCSMSGVLQTDGKLSDKAWSRLQEYLAEFRSGGSKRGSFLTLEEGLKYISARMTNKDAEFVDLKKQAIKDIGSIFGVPSYQLGDGEKVSYSSQEEENRNFLYSTMLFRARLFENELTNKLISAEERANGKRIEADFRGLMRGAMKDRAEYYRKLFEIGAIDSDTICMMEDLPLAESGGKKRYVPSNLVEVGASIPIGKETITKDE